MRSIYDYTQIPNKADSIYVCIITADCFIDFIFSHWINVLYVAYFVEKLLINSI